MHESQPTQQEVVAGSVREIIEELKRQFAVEAWDGDENPVNGEPDFQEARKAIDFLSEGLGDRKDAILEVLSRLESEYKFGGSEDAEGRLKPGTPNFDDAIKFVNEIMSQGFTNGLDF